MVLGSSFHDAGMLVDQVVFQLSRFGAEASSMGIVLISLTREVIPLLLGLVLAFMIPFLNILAYYMIARSELPRKDQQNILLRTHIKSTLIVTPALLLGGLTTAFIAAYFQSPLININELINFDDYILCICKCMSFTLALIVLEFFEIMILYRRKKLIELLAVCIISIIVNSSVIVAFDSGIGYLCGTH